jgi:hypothetical protein
MCVKPSVKYLRAISLNVNGGGGATSDTSALSVPPSIQIVCAALSPIRTISANVPAARSYPNVKPLESDGIVPVNRTTDGDCAKSLKADDGWYSKRGVTATWSYFKRTESRNDALSADMRRSRSSRSRGGATSPVSRICRRVSRASGSTTTSN